MNQNVELFHPEIVIGLIGGIGTDFGSAIKSLENEFSECGYRIEKIKISELFNNLNINTQVRNKKTHFKSKESRLYIKLPLNNGSENAFAETYKEMQAGSYLRRYNRDILARLAVARINELRGKSNTLGKVVYILKSLKRKEEFDLLNRIYGRNFVSISIFTSEENRKKNLLRKFKSSTRHKKIKLTEHGTFMGHYIKKPEEAVELMINKDFQETDEDFKRNKCGQDIVGLYSHAHYFINNNPGENSEKQIERFVEILMGKPYAQPKNSEYFMCLAQSAAYLSLDMSRQVGAVIISEEGDILSSGYNTVCKPGGTPYFEGDDPNYQDYMIGYELNTVIKKDIYAELIKNLIDKKLLTPNEKKDFLKIIGESSIDDITEYSRPTHAEMLALCVAARRGVSVKNGILYCNTFPCHNCLKNILSSGIKKIVYLHPYPKNRVELMYSDLVNIDEPTHKIEGTISYEPFIGVSHNRYMYVFQHDKKTRQDPEQDGYVKKWTKEAAYPAYLDGETPLNYINLEKIIIEWLNKNLKKQLIKKIRFHSNQIKKWGLGAWPNKKDPDGFLN